MSDAYGMLPLPVTVAEGDVAIGDPLLDKLLAFFEAVIMHDCADAWNIASGNNGNQPLVKRTFAHNPADQAFRKMTTPALYLWRESIGTAVWRAADYRIRPSELILRWVPFAPNSQERKRVWEPFFNAIPSALDAAVERGRNPGWMVTGDTDQMADTLGSYVYKYINVWKLLVDVSAAKRVTLTIPLEGNTPPRTFQAIDIPIGLEERLNEDSTKFGVLAYTEAAFVVPAEPPTLPLTLATVTGQLNFDPEAP